MCFRVAFSPSATFHRGSPGSVRSCGRLDADLTRRHLVHHRVVDARFRSVGRSAYYLAALRARARASTPCGQPNAKETALGPTEEKKVIVALRDSRYLVDTRRCRMVYPRIVGPCRRGEGKSGAQRETRSLPPGIEKHRIDEKVKELVSSLRSPV